MYWVSAVSLAVVMALCFAGTFAPKTIFDDNLAERAGMAGIFMFCLARFTRLIEAGEMTSHLIPGTIQVIGHAGLALYFSGAAGAKIAAWRRKGQKRQPPMPPIIIDRLHGVRGGHK